jgi:hypothetical protein
MIRFALALLCFALAVIATPARAHSPASAQTSVMLSHDKPSGTRGYGLDANATVTIVNAGVALRSWESDVTGWNGRRLHNEAAVYVGLGFLNLIQFQTGFSNAGRRNRVRSDIFLSENFPLPAFGGQYWGSVKHGIVISPFVETGSGKKVYGLGIGLSMD